MPALVLIFLLVGCGAPASSSSPGSSEASRSTVGEEAPPSEPEAPPSEPPPPLTPSAGAMRLGSGLAMRQLEGDTERGGTVESSRVRVRYRAWDATGARVDGGGPEGAEGRWLLMALPPGLNEAFTILVEGQTWMLWIPASLGREGEGDRVWEVTHLGALERPLPETPADVAAPPAEAERTASGLASVVLEEGTGTRHPTPTDHVLVHYTGWTADGRRFDSSIARGREVSFPVSGVIHGWTEGLQLMVEGEVRRLWIPSELAYGDRPNRPELPAGALVFDVELMEIR